MVLEQLGRKGKVALLMGPSGAPTFKNLGDGYSEVMAKYPGIQIVFRADGPLTRERGVKQAEDVLVANPDLAAIYAANDRLYIAKADFDYYAELVDKNDQVQAAIQLDSGYMKTGTATINRAKDDAVIAGFFGMMLTGKSGTVQVPFPSGNVIAVDVGAPTGTATGLNLGKVKAAAKQLGQAFNRMRRSLEKAISLIEK